ncbi:CehA/McbA family metallohydrolase [Butyrivibrio sp. VCB2006]|uniref:CehA/McbA family metallohydrolase n=1 Tax=Butyrivibrio sp. VCB2006 TaxID=1280679 RepID=UPI00040E3B12|nr:CehA/McbA family metallohydrolase [Butyrivibrio sp. VCB2006]
MSKETKFLSIAIGLLQGIYKDEGISDKSVASMDADRLYKYVRVVNESYIDPAHKRTNEVDFAGKNDRNRFHNNGIIGPDVPLGNVFVETHFSGAGTPAQVKFFKLLEGEDTGNFDRVNGKITMIREMTGFDGCLFRKLPVGRYVVEVSKGCECEIITDDMEIAEGGLTRKSYELNRFVNLEGEGWISGELHHHCVYSSPVFGGDDDVVETPEQVANSMMAMGLAYGALSDHHIILSHPAWKANKRSNFVPIISKEISTTRGHVMAMGVPIDVIFDIPDEDKRTDEYMRNEFVRITDEIKENGGLAQINHPRDLQKSISWNPDFEDMLDIFETMEIWNGSNPMMTGSTNDAAFELWNRCLQRGLFLPATTGSDTHNICADDYHILFDEIMDVLDAIKANEKELSEKFADETKVMLEIGDKLLPILEKWAETNLTSGCVRTYINFDVAEPRENTHNPEYIMERLRKGRSFLTNGPILLTKVNGKIPGHNVRLSEGKKKVDKLNIEVRLLANRKLKTFEIRTENGLVKELPLRGSKKNGFYDYSMDIEETIPDGNYLYFIAKDDCTNLAITNPVILNR